MKKKKWVRTSKKKKIIIAGTAFVLAGGVAAGAFFLLPKNNGMQMERNVGGAQSATVSTGSITTTVVGTGNLSVDTATDITIPTGIEIDEVKVESGDTVAKGDVLATVNTDSVKSAMLSTQEEIETIDGELEDAQEDSSYSYITADVSGTVTAVYAASGEDVTDVMAENGALMTMTLDDDNDTEITITAASGTVSKVYVYEGESISSGDYLFYLSGTSESAAYQELVNERKQLSEKLQKLSALYKSNEITADFSGIVQSVNVTASSTTSSSTTSGTSTGTSGTAGSGNTTASAASDDTVVTASAASDDAVVTASAASEGTTDGAVVTVAASKNSSSAENNVASAAFTLTSTSSSRTMKAVSATTTGATEEEVTQSEEKETKAAETASEAKAAEESANAETKSATEDISVTKIKNIVVTPVTGNVPQSQIDETDYYTGSITWNTDEEAYSGGTCYTATVKLKSKTSEDGAYRYIFPQNVEVSQDNADIVVVSVSDTKLEYTVTFAATEVPQSETETEKITEASSETIAESDTNAQSESGQKESQSGQSEEQSESQNGQSESQNGTTGGSSSGASGSSGSVSASGSSGTASASGSTSSGTTSSSTTSSSTSSTTSTNTNEMTAFSVSDDTNMLLAVSVDELDINSVAVGQEATLTFDALEDQEFTGAITSIGTTASVNGGVAKYTVNIEVPKTDDMRVGMNASATITVADAQDILLIPSAALQEKGDKTFVYTSQDETSGELSGEVEVETGLSDGSNVEITSGLSDGDTVYYTRSASSDSSSSDSSMQDMMGMMGGSSGGGNFDRSDKSSGNFGGGTPPSGGGAPSGN